MSRFNKLKYDFWYIPHQLIIKVILIADFISSNLEFWSVDHTSKYKNYESMFFKV